MDTSFYDAILRDAIWRHATIFLVVGALLVIGLILNIVFYRGTLKRLAQARGQEAERLAKKRDQMLIALLAETIAFLCCIAMGYFRVAKMCKDLSQHSYIMIEATYNRPMHQRSITDDGDAFVTIDGEQVLMYLASDGDADEFPFGTHTGTVCYAAESKMLLSFSEREGAE